MVTKEPLSMYESVAELPEFVGTAWRAESGYWHAPGTTVADIIRFEREELGNEYPDISDKLLQNLDHYSASAAVWINRRRKDCLRYLSEGESEEAVGRVHLPKGSKIIAPDYCGGYLVLRGRAEPVKPEIIAKPPAVEEVPKVVPEVIEDIITVYRGITGREGDRFLVTTDRTIAESHSEEVVEYKVRRSELESGDEEFGFYDGEVPSGKVGDVEAWLSRKDIITKPPAVEEVKPGGNPMPSANDLMPMSPTEGEKPRDLPR